jgi:hypothetical protein
MTQKAFRTSRFIEHDIPLIKSRLKHEEDKIKKLIAFAEDELKTDLMIFS